MFGSHSTGRAFGDKQISPASFILVLMGYSIVSVIISVFSFIHLNKDVDNFDDIITNWNTPAIMNIAVANQCPENFETGYANQWPGTESGCWCGDVSYFIRHHYNIYCTLCTGYCGWNQTLAGCEDIDPIPAIPLDYWGQVDGVKMKICVQRSTETWAQVAPRSGENCTDASLRKCGTSPELAFCTAEPQCPINNIKITTLDQTSPILANCTAQNKCFLLDNNGTSSKVLQFQRGDTYDALPSSQMRLNEYGMCKDMTWDNITPDRDDFKLLEETRSTCENEGANMWDRTDVMTETQLFLLNNVTPQIQKLNAYGGYYEKGATGDNYTWGFFSRDYVPWHINCRGRMDEIVNLQPDVENLRRCQLALMIITSISGIFLGIVLPCFLCYNMQGEDACFGHAHYGRQRMMKTGQIYSYIAKILQIPFQIVTVILASNIENFLISIAEYKCSDADTLQTLDDLQGDVHEAYYNDFLNIILLLSVLLFDTIFFITNSQIIKNLGYQQLPENDEPEVSEINREALQHPNEPVEVIHTDLRA